MRSNIPWLLLLAACAGDKDATDTGTPTDTPPAQTGDTGPPAPEYEATWTGVQQLFVDHCDRCHPAQQGLDLHTAIPYDAGYYQRLVKPGDPDSSVLWLVVSGGTILEMPLDTGLLPLPTVQPIHDWIAAGASFDE